VSRVSGSGGIGEIAVRGQRDQRPGTGFAPIAAVRILHAPATHPIMADTPRRLTFEHDGHRFESTQQASRADEGAEPSVHWVVLIDGGPALEFRGPHPYRDEDVRKRVLEWYAIQHPARNQGR
jgi:hypothetical protein